MCECVRVCVCALPLPTHRQTLRLTVLCIYTSRTIIAANTERHLPASICNGHRLRSL